MSLAKFGGSDTRLCINTVSTLLLKICSFALPTYGPTGARGGSLLSTFKLSTLILFGEGGVTVFFLFSVLLKTTLRVAGACNSLFLNDFTNVPRFTSSFKIGRSIVLLSVSRVSRALFVLTVPFFLGRFNVGRIVLVDVFT